MRMKRLTTYHLLPFLLLPVLEAVSFAQGPAANKAKASIAGRITVGGLPAPGAQVLLKKSDDPAPGFGPAESPAAATATTNADGRYQITNLPAGVYRISVYAPAYIIEGESRLSYEYGKTVTLAEGDDVGNLDFSLIHGGVITGKVTDEDGKPVIAESVGVFRIDEQGKPDSTAIGGMLHWQTDDRGVYRIFGLEPGRYMVGAGASGEDKLRPIGSRGSYKRTYHPDAVDESNANIIEVKPGGEVENVDIKLARAAKSYKAAGRVIDSETGKPLPGMMITCELAKTAGSSFRPGDATTNANGEFRIEGLLPNTYIIYVLNLGQSDSYSDKVNFEIGDDDVTNLEIKMVRGASISGVAEVEGARDPAVLAQLSQIQLRAEGASQDTATMMLTLMQGGGIGVINPDRTLRIGGVRPGRTRVVATIPPELKGFTLARVERNGVEIGEFDVTQGEQITGVRLVFTYGTSVLAGHVEIKGGTLPANAQMTVRLVREGAGPEDWWFAKHASVDARGQFTIEGVSPGNYKAYLLTFVYGEDPQPILPKVEQAVSIPDNTRQEITLVMEFTKEGERFIKEAGK